MPAKAKSSKTKEELKLKKTNYLAKVISLLEEYPRFLIVTCDNIGSKLMQTIRLSLREIGAVLLMGKNTLIKKAIKDKLEQYPHWEPLLNAIRLNCGIVLTKGSLADVQKVLEEHTVPASAKTGSVAPEDVVIQKQVTTLEPTKTSFFAALDIATKITKGCVEILNPVKLCEKGKRVGSSEAALLSMLDIRPFKYGLIINNCFEGSLFNPAFLSYGESHLFQSIASGIGRVAALSLAISYPTLPAFPHVVASGFKNLLAVAIETNYVFKEAEEVKRRVENPEAYAPTTTTTTTTTTATTAAPTKVEAPVQKEPSSEEEEDGGGLADFF